MNKKIGFIGYGNMAQAMVGGIITQLPAENIMVSDLQLPTDHRGIKTTTNNTLVAEFADVLVIATKPNQYQTVITEIKNHLKPTTIIVSIAAGLTMQTLENLFDRPVKLVRTMPNTPARVASGMTAIIPNAQMTDVDTELVVQIFTSFGAAEIVDEALIEAVIVTSGSSPAYVYMFIEAMIQGGINEGMTREMATRFASSAVMGAAKMVTETGVLPNDLCDAVCSPNGTTIEAVKSLQAAGFEAIITKAMKACADRSRAMAKE